MAPAPLILLVGSAAWPTGPASRAWQALQDAAPGALLQPAIAGVRLGAEVDGVWLMAPPPGEPAEVHDATIGDALHLGIPLLGSLAGPEVGGRGEELTRAPGSRWRLEGTVDAAPVLGLEGHPFARLTGAALTATEGPHLLVTGLARAAGARAAQRPEARPATPAPPGTAAVPSSWPATPVPPGMPAPPPPMVSPGPSGWAPLPDDGTPRPYVHQMRTSGYRWWRPFLALAVGIGSYLAFSCIIGAAWLIADPDMMSIEGIEDVDLLDPRTMLFNNLTLAALIPAVLLATRVGHWRPAGRIWSVTGRLRWRWLAQAGLVTLLLWGGYLAMAWLLGGGETSSRPEHLGWLLVITLLTTPLQAAGEEVAFRGALLQGVGAWIRNPVVAIVVGTVLSTGLFAAAHGSPDPWTLIDLGGMAAATCYLTWRTGGIEAATALHVVNNLVITVGLLLLGGLESAYVTGETSGNAAASLISLVATAGMTLVLVEVAKRVGVAPARPGWPAEG